MKTNRTITRLLCALLCLCLCLSACRNDADPTTTGGAENPKDAIYTISVKTAGGMPFAGLVAYVYEDATEDDLLTYGTLDENGSFTFTAAESDKYTVRFPNLPAEGYDVQEYYAITGTDTAIVLTSSVISGKDALESGKRYELGDVMRDFTVTTVDGQALTLSELLQEKQAVVLNFWYTGCGPCKNEFPLLQAAYEAYSDKLEVITMNPTDITGDDAASIIAFRDSYGLTMPMATCSSQWLSALGFSSYPTTVIIDRYGVLCLTAGAVDTQEVFEAAFAHFTAEDYQQKLIENIEDMNTVEYEVGHPKNPYQAHGGMEEFEVTVAGGAEFHAVLFRGDGLILRIEDPNAYLIVGEDRYEPNSKGVIEVQISNPDVTTGTNLIIGNTGVTQSVIKVELVLPKGTFTNPHEGSLGTNTVTVEEGNEQGVYYTWTAPADGVLTVTVTNKPENDHDVQLYNLNTYAVRNLGEEELVDENGNRYVSVKVSAGDVVSIGYMSVPDAAYNYPEVTIESELSFAEGGEETPKYSISFKDSDGNPIADVKVSLSVDGVDTVFVSDENGLILIDLPSGMYTVKVTVPEGYVCETTQFLLTESNTSMEIVMSLYVPQEVAYTVYVVDEQGKPVANAAVVLDDRYVYTDANGMVSLLLLESEDYEVTVVAPDGYTLEKTKYAFGKETTLTVVVTKAAGETNELDYTVTVVDPDGKPYTDVMVTLESENGSTSVTEAVDASGKVTVRLPEGNYKVTLVFSAANTMGYEPTTAKLTASKNSITITVAPYLNGASQTLYTGAEAYELEDGSFYVDLTGKDIQYFVFTPTQTGIYTFTTTNSAAAVSYWGMPSFLNKSDENIKNNVLTLEVKGVGPTYVLAVSGGEGITGTIVQIQRTGNIKQMEREVYQGTTTPTEPFVADVTGTKTFLDLSVEQTLVKGEDGYYHLGTADGPVVMVDLKTGNYEISISALVANSAMVKYEYDSDGDPIKRIDYTDCMTQYVENVDEKLGVYALTDDLMTILQNHGENAGWYDSSSASYLFGSDPVLEGQGWMFLLCVFQ